MLTGIARQMVQELCGEAVSEQDLVGGNAENPGGFFESHLLVETSNHLLALVNATWDRPFLARPVWQNPQLLEELIRLREKFSPYWKEPWIDKDPRVCLLWDAYSHILLRRPTGILVVRNPLKVAASLQLRNGFTETKSALIWWLYNFHIIRAAERDRLLIICDDSLSRCQADCLARLASFLKQNLLAEVDASETQLAARLDSLLRQRFEPSYRRATAAEPRHGGLLRHAFDSWKRWQAADCDQEQWRSEFNLLPAVVLDSYEEELGQGRQAEHPPMSQTFAQRCEIMQSQAGLIAELQNQLAARENACAVRPDLNLQTLTEERGQLELRCNQLIQNIDELRSSTSWRLTRPLRWMGDRWKTARHPDTNPS